LLPGLYWGLLGISYFLSLFTKQTNISWSTNLIRPIFTLPSDIFTFMWGLIYIVLGWVSGAVWNLEKCSLRSLTFTALDSTIIFIGSVYLGLLLHKLDKKLFYPYLIYVIWMFYELAFGLFGYFLNR
jgi:tryptophan-rich sensory protein